MNKLIFLFLLIIFFNSCSSKYEVRVNSFKDYAFQDNKTYYIYEGNPGTDINSLEFKEYANYLHKALKLKGYNLTKYEKANLLLSFQFNVSEPKKEMKIESYEQQDYDVYKKKMVSKGMASRSKSSTYYDRSVTITAINGENYRDKKEKVEIWKTTIKSTGSSGDMRQVFPILIGASYEYLDSNTGKEINVEITENDQRVIQIKSE